MGDEMSVTQYPSGIFIPANIYLDRNLKPIERIYLALLRQYSEKQADEIMEYGSKEKELKKVKNSLIKKGYYRKE